MLSYNILKPDIVIQVVMAALLWRASALDANQNASLHLSKNRLKSAYSRDVSKDNGDNRC